MRAYGYGYMSNGVQDIDRGYKQFLEQVSKLKKEPYVKVGVLGTKASEKYPDSAFSVVDVATVNEFGSSDGRIPERSYLRATIDKKLSSYRNLLGALVSDYFLRKTTPGKILAVMGLKISSDVQDRIVSLRDPPNAPGTVASKKSSNPLIDSGRLRQSISFEVVENGDS